MSLSASQSYVFKKTPNVVLLSIKALNLPPLLLCTHQEARQDMHVTGEALLHPIPDSVEPFLHFLSITKFLVKSGIVIGVLERQEVCAKQGYLSVCVH